VRTERLVLRSLRRGDEAAVFAYRRRADVCRYIPADLMTEEAAPQFITDRVDATNIAADGDRIVFGVELDGQVIGDVLIRVERFGDAQAELGWVFNPEFGGRGYATEAARALVELAFGSLGMHRVWAQLDPRNGASARMCERLGMRHEAHLQQDMWLNGEWTDAAIYARGAAAAPAAPVRDAPYSCGSAPAGQRRGRTVPR